MILDKVRFLNNPKSAAHAKTPSYSNSESTHLVPKLALPAAWREAICQMSQCDSLPKLE